MLLSSNSESKMLEKRSSGQAAGESRASRRAGGQRRQESDSGLRRSAQLALCLLGLGQVLGGCSSLEAGRVISRSCSKQSEECAER